MKALEKLPFWPPRETEEILVSRIRAFAVDFFTASALL
jgi:hypothetical protein